MLLATLTGLRRERRHLTPGYRRQIKAGWRGWSAFYGELIVEQLCGAAIAGRARSWPVHACCCGIAATRS
jgi:hypothetical protein